MQNNGAVLYTISPYSADYAFFVSFFITIGYAFIPSAISILTWRAFLQRNKSVQLASFLLRRLLSECWLKDYPAQHVNANVQYKLICPSLVRHCFIVW
jgi:hypothetical protein